jgi:hypothetical protein
MLSASLNQFGTSSLEWLKSEIFIPLFLLGTLFVILGVFMERDGLPERIVNWGWTILLWGLAMELFASIGQLAIDGEIGNRQREEIFSLEGTSNAQQSTISSQQSKIIELESKIAPRDLNEIQRQEIAEAIKPFSGISFDLSMTPEIEPMRLVDQIEAALSLGGWVEQLDISPSAKFNRLNKSPVGERTVAGVWIIYPNWLGPEYENAAKALGSRLITSNRSRRRCRRPRGSWRRFGRIE